MKNKAQTNETSNQNINYLKLELKNISDNEIIKAILKL